MRAVAGRGDEAKMGRASVRQIHKATGVLGGSTEERGYMRKDTALLHREPRAGSSLAPSQTDQPGVERALGWGGGVVGGEPGSESSVGMFQRT